MICEQCQNNEADESTYYNGKICDTCLERSWRKAAKIVSSLGQKRNFVDAVRSLREAYKLEALGSNTEATWLEYVKECTKAIEVYQDTIAAARQNCLLRLREEGLEKYADAFEDDDYSILEY